MASERGGGKIGYQRIARVTIIILLSLSYTYSAEGEEEFLTPALASKTEHRILRKKESMIRKLEADIRTLDKRRVHLVEITEKAKERIRGIQKQANQKLAALDQEKARTNVLVNKLKKPDQIEGLPPALVSAPVPMKPQAASKGKPMVGHRQLPSASRPIPQDDSLELGEEGE